VTDQPGSGTFPVVVEHVDLVRVEKSLHSLGFFASTANREISRTVVQIFRRPDGQRIHAKAVIEGIPSLGLPTTADRDKYMAFMKFALDRREIQGHLTNPIRFSGADMIKLLRLRKGGFHYDEINDWCKRMVATTIMSEASIFLADRRQYATDTFHVFDRVVLVGEELNDGTRSEFYQVYLSEWQLTNLNQGYLLPLDFNAYLRLHRDIAKALFGQLSVWFYASRGQAVEKKYPDLCQLLNIRAYPHLSKARAVLEPSLNELMEIGYLSSWDLIRTARGTDFKLELSPGKRLLSLPNFASVVNPDARAVLDAHLPAWVAELLKRGVVERKARQLALDIPDGQPVFDQIEYADYLIQQDRRGRGKISNPAGFYIWAIENNLSVPAHFETSRARRARTEQTSNMIELTNGYDEFCQQQILKKLESDYPQDRLETALREHLKSVKREQPEWFARVPENTRREVAMSRLKAAIREHLALPSFERWHKQTLQERLF
jgi:Replication initiator protein A